MARPEDDSEAQSRRILRRVAGESEPGVRFLEKASVKAQRHFAAGDVDPADRIEVWGTRIGRGIAIAISIGMIVWIAAYLTGHG